MIASEPKFQIIRFAIIKYTSKSDKKISVTDRMTEWQTDRLIDWLTDICIPRAAFAAENTQDAVGFFYTAIFYLQKGSFLLEF